MIPVDAFGANNGKYVKSIKTNLIDKSYKFIYNGSHNTMDMATIWPKKMNKRTEGHFYFALVTIPWGDHIPDTVV